MIFQVQRQRTAGAYITLGTFTTHGAAVDELRRIAAQTPEIPYDGGDRYQDSQNVHRVNRYRIVGISIA